jgi:hypothetical protein
MSVEVVRVCKMLIDVQSFYTYFCLVFTKTAVLPYLYPVHEAFSIFSVAANVGKLENMAGMTFPVLSLYYPYII